MIMIITAVQFVPKLTTENISPTLFKENQKQIAEGLVHTQSLFCNGEMIKQIIEQQQQNAITREKKI